MSPFHGDRPNAAEAAGGVGIAPLLALLTLVLFAWLVMRHAFIGDDAFISFRYARNLIDGHGLVFNPGERVEGYTNFSWVLLMALVMKLGLAPEVVSNVLGVASGAAILGLVAWLGARARGWSDPLIWIAPLALASNRTFTAWSTGGLETQFFSLLVLAGLIRFDLEQERSAERAVASAILLGTATLTRPEGVLAFCVAAAWFAFAVLIRRRRNLAALVAWSTVYFVIVGAQLVFRLAYYGDPLPNTFYAKVSGLWWEQSSIWFGMFLRQYQLWLFGWLMFVPLLLRRDARSLLFGSFLAVYVAYLVYIGGDIFEFRFMTPLLPYAYWLMQEGVRLGSGWLEGRGLRRRTALVAGALTGALLVVITYQPSRITKPWRKHGIASVEAVRAYAISRAQQGRALRELIDGGYLAGDELIAVGGAGALPYYAGLPTLDFRGLNDRHIARQEVRTRGWIGHEKHASMEYLRERGVVIFDVLNRIVHEPDSPAIGTRRFERFGYRGSLRCIEAKGLYLVFATTLSDEDFRRRLEHFRILY